MLKKIISGCQTGADRAGLDAALKLGVATGGTCTKGNRTDEGFRPDLIVKYGLTEDTSSAYAPRTEANVIDSDGTVLFGRMNSSGSALTIKLCLKHNKPYIINPNCDELKAWLIEHNIEVLNVAGNRERTNPGVYERVLSVFLEKEQASIAAPVEDCK